MDGANFQNVVYGFMFQAAEALGAIGLEDNAPLLRNSLIEDPAQEVRETCELALKRIEEMNATSVGNGSATVEKSPFMSVDPAAPTASCSSVDELRYIQFLISTFSIIQVVRLLT